MTNLVVYVEGGMVQAMYSDDEDIVWNVIVVDQDNISQGDSEPEQWIKDIMIPSNAIY